MSDKIRAHHLERSAYVYIRQSTLSQVQHNRESQHRQRALSRRPEELGWPAERIVVVDDDLGLTGTRADNRPGYQHIMDAVCRGEVGILFAVDASRHARNDTDWCRLLDLCAQLGVLLGDEQRIYDPAHRDDRVLLGIQGALAVYELSLFRERAQQAILEKARRGEFYTHVPVGVVRTEHGGLDKHSDVRVQQALELLFDQFRRLRSARQVARWFHERQVELPYLPRGAKPEEVKWAAPGYPQVLNILEHPMYAGAYVYGRTGTDVEVDENREIHKRRGRRRPRSEWTSLILDHHPGYITWAEYERNQEQIQSNANMNGQMTKGSVRAGGALLPGLLRCRRCGRKLVVRYSGGVGRYACDGPGDQRYRRDCLRFGAPRVDEAVGEALLDAVEPAGVRAALRAQELLSQEHAQQREALKLAVQQAEYEADRAYRTYANVEPENRLAAAELERRWEETLRTLQQARSRLEALKTEVNPLPPHEAEELMKMGRDVRRVWSHPDADMALKKRVVRTVIEEVLVDVVDDGETISLLIHWVGGHHTELPVAKRGRQSRAAVADLLAVVGALRSVMNDEAIARSLNRVGLQTLRGNSWTAARVRGYRHRHGLACFSEREKAEQGLLLQSEAANRAGISAMSVHRLIERGILTAERPLPGLPCIIRESDLCATEVQRAIEAMKKGRTDPLTDPPNQKNLF